MTRSQPLVKDRPYWKAPCWCPSRRRGVGHGRFRFDCRGSPILLSAVPSNLDAFYHIETGGLFVDRSGASANTQVDASAATGGIAYKGSDADDGAGFSFQGSAFGDTVNGGAGADSISTGEGNNYALGGDGADSITAGGGADTIIGGAGDDAISGGNGANNLQGGDGNDTILGGADNDSISGGSGNDNLWGGAGNDTILGGDGNDSIVGGAGDDMLIGGAGSDVFAYGDGFGGNDTIVGFSYGQDFVAIKAGMGGLTSLSGFDGVTNKIEVVGSSVKVTIGTDTILIKGIAGASTSDLLSNPENWIKIV
ncbi:calcium-binding protein [Paeniroseomonas aquatica]|uniref:calcium-binding protein n=1 Tax=Paeniroseomonas aquatica TaxID=373043 RepID=UPI0036080268